MCVCVYVYAYSNLIWLINDAHKKCIKFKCCEPSYIFVLKLDNLRTYVRAYVCAR